MYSKHIEMVKKNQLKNATKLKSEFKHGEKKFSLPFSHEAEQHTQPTSCWHSKVKLSGRGPPGLSPVHTSGFENTEPFFEVPGSQTGAIPLSHHP
jgi:hypothetical protein